MSNGVTVRIYPRSLRVEGQRPAGFRLELGKRQFAGNRTERQIDTRSQMLHAGCSCKRDQCNQKGIFDQILTIFPNQALQLGQNIAELEFQNSLLPGE